MIFVILLLLTGCTKYDKSQSIADCEFDIATKMNVDHDNYIYACMNKKGYVFNFKDSCFNYRGMETCWNYSWRVFL